MTALDQITPLSAEQRQDLIKQHEYDELIFGGFICLHCTPDGCDDPDDNVYYPCPPLRAAGVTDEEAVLIIKLARAERAAKHMGDALGKVATVMRNAATTAQELGAGAGMDVIIGYLSDAGMLPAGVLLDLPNKEVALLKAVVERVQAVAKSPVEHQCERDGRASWVRLRDLQEALGSTPDGRGVA